MTGNENSELIQWSEAAGATGPGIPSGTLRVSMLAQQIQASLKQAFPRRVWVVGEVSELERSIQRGGRHWFFSLTEENPEDDRKYSLGAILWSSEVSRLFGKGGVLDGVVEPKDGIEIRALCDVDFYPPNGTLRLVVRDIDATYTLGKIAIHRQELIDRLLKEGVLEQQKALNLEEVPLRVGLVTSENSAAYKDFVNELLGSGISFHVRFLDARMQGEDTVKTVVQSLQTLAAENVDVIAVIRGGGSMVDLAWFDQEDLVRAVAACPVPVISGIGHEIDTSVADLAAHTSLKTPTAAAAFLVSRTLEAQRSLVDSMRRLEEIALLPDKELRQIADTLQRLLLVTEKFVSSEERWVGQKRVNLFGLTHRIVSSSLRDVAALGTRLGTASVRERLATASSELGSTRRGLEKAVANRLARSMDQLEGRIVRCRLLDPRNTLNRGFSILRGRNGKILKDVSRVKGGMIITAELRDGELTARVESSRSNEMERTSHGEESKGEDGQATGGGLQQLEIW